VFLWLRRQITVVLSSSILLFFIAASRSLQNNVRSGQHCRGARSIVMLALALNLDRNIQSADLLDCDVNQVLKIVARLCQYFVW